MAEDFSRRVARVVAAQLAEIQGFEAVQESAVEVLAELLLRYLAELCSTTHGYAELATRADTNLADMVSALEDLGMSIADLHSYLDDTVNRQVNVPFVHPLPEYPTRKTSVLKPSFEDKGEEAAPHIPSFLPALPDRHTFVQTPAYPKHEEDPVKQQQAVQAGRKLAEEALVQLHRRLAHTTDDPEADTDAATNPFLAPPLFENTPLPSRPISSSAAPNTTAGAVSGGGGTAQTSNGLAGGLDLSLGTHAFQPVLGDLTAGAGRGAGGADPMDLDRGPGRSEAEGLMWSRDVPEDDRSGWVLMPDGPLLDVGTSIQREAISFAVRRPWDDAFKPQQEVDPRSRASSVRSRYASVSDPLKAKAAERAREVLDRWNKQSGGGDGAD